MEPTDNAERVTVASTAAGSHKTARAIARSAAVLGYETSHQRPPDGLAVGFADFPFRDPTATFEEHLAAVEREQPDIAVAPDLDATREPSTVYDQADRLAEHAGAVVVITKREDTHPTEIPDRFRVGVPLQGDDGGEQATLDGTGADETDGFAGRTPWRIADYRDAGDVHLLGGSPNVHREAAKYLDVASVDTSTPERVAKYGDYWTPDGWENAGEGADLYDTIRASLDHMVAWWADRNGYESPVDPEPPEIIRDGVTAQEPALADPGDALGYGAPPEPTGDDADLWAEQDYAEESVPGIDLDGAVEADLVDPELAEEYRAEQIDQENAAIERVRRQSDPIATDGGAEVQSHMSQDTDYADGSKKTKITAISGIGDRTEEKIEDLGTLATLDSLAGTYSTSRDHEDRHAELREGIEDILRSDQFEALAEALREYVPTSRKDHDLAYLDGDDPDADDGTSEDQEADAWVARYGINGALSEYGHHHPARQDFMAWVRENEEELGGNLVAAAYDLGPRQFNFGSWATEDPDQHSDKIRVVNAWLGNEHPDILADAEDQYQEDLEEQAEKEREEQRKREHAEMLLEEPNRLGDDALNGWEPIHADHLPGITLDAAAHVVGYSPGGDASLAAIYRDETGRWQGGEYLLEDVLDAGGLRSASPNRHFLIGTIDSANEAAQDLLKHLSLSSGEAPDGSNPADAVLDQADDSRDRKKVMVEDPETGEHTPVGVPETVNGWEETKPPAFIGAIGWENPNAEGTEMIGVDKSGAFTWDATHYTKTEDASETRQIDHADRAKPAVDAAVDYMEANDPTGPDTDGSESFSVEKQGTLGSNVEAEESANEERQVSLFGNDPGEDTPMPDDWRKGNGINWEAGPLTVTYYGNKVVLSDERADERRHTVADDIDREIGRAVAERFTDEIAPPEVSFHNAENGAVLDAAAEAKKAISEANADDGLGAFSDDSDDAVAGPPAGGDAPYRIGPMASWVRVHDGGDDLRVVSYQNDDGNGPRRLSIEEYADGNWVIDHVNTDWDERTEIAEAGTWEQALAEAKEYVGQAAVMGHTPEDPTNADDGHDWEVGDVVNIRHRGDGIDYGDGDASEIWYAEVTDVDGDEITVDPPSEHTNDYIEIDLSEMRMVEKKGNHRVRSRADVLDIYEYEEKHGDMGQVEIELGDWEASTTRTALNNAERYDLADEFEEGTVSVIEQHAQEAVDALIEYSAKKESGFRSIMGRNDDTIRHAERAVQAFEAAGVEPTDETGREALAAKDRVSETTEEREGFVEEMMLDLNDTGLAPFDIRNTPGISGENYKTLSEGEFIHNDDQDRPDRREHERELYGDALADQPDTSAGEGDGTESRPYSIDTTEEAIRAGVEALGLLRRSYNKKREYLQEDDIYREDITHAIEAFNTSSGGRVALTNAERRAVWAATAHRVDHHGMTSEISALEDALVDAEFAAEGKDDQTPSASEESSSDETAASEPHGILAPEVEKRDIGEWEGVSDYDMNPTAASLILSVEEGRLSVGWDQIGRNWVVDHTTPSSWTRTTDDVEEALEIAKEAAARIAAGKPAYPDGAGTDSEPEEDDHVGAGEKVEFASLDEANDYRDDLSDDDLHPDDTRRTKTITLAPDASEELIEEANDAALVTFADERKEYGQEKLTDDERATLEKRDGWTWGSHGFEAMSVKAALEAEGATDWLNYYEKGEGVDGSLSNLEAGKEATARTGAGNALSGDYREDEISRAEEARKQEKAEAEACGHAVEGCESGYQEACKELKENCGYSDEEIEQLRQGIEDLGETPEEALAGTVYDPTEDTDGDDDPAQPFEEWAAENEPDGPEVSEEELATLAPSRPGPDDYRPEVLERDGIEMGDGFEFEPLPTAATRVIGKAWKGYRVSRVEATEAMGKAEDYAQTINGVRMANGLRPLEFNELEGLAESAHVPEDPNSKYPTGDGKRSLLDAMRQGALRVAGGDIYDPTEDL